MYIRFSYFELVKQPNLGFAQQTGFFSRVGSMATITNKIIFHAQNIGMNGSIGMKGSINQCFLGEEIPICVFDNENNLLETRKPKMKF